jgi:hypothetical protein
VIGFIKNLKENEKMINSLKYITKKEKSACSSNKCSIQKESLLLTYSYRDGMEDYLNILNIKLN